MDAALYKRAVRRMRVFMLVISAVGTVAALVMKGRAWGGGFFLGALISLLNLYWLDGLVSSLGGSGRPPRRWLALILAGRFLLLGIGGYVIVNFIGLNLAAAVTGLFLAVAGAVFEVLYELIYART